MFQRLKSFAGLGRRPAPARTAAPVRVVRGRYDAAQTTNDNRRHWGEADSLSARAANTAAVRQRLRDRARYERANNSYCRRTSRALAYWVVGTGPRLQLLTEDAELNRDVETTFAAWCQAIGLAAKLRTMRQAKAVDGEAFALLTTNPRLATPVKLDIRLIEADQIATPNPSDLDEFSVDGIRLDRNYLPVEYHVMRSHPGDSYAYTWGWEYDRVPADLMIHWFDAERPGQYRGVPEMTAALPLFAQLRRYTLAVIAAAETAADFAGVLQSQLPPDAEGVEGEPFETVEAEKRMLTTLPAGYTLEQLKAEQPTTSYPDFKREILSEIGVCVDVPVNVITGDSSRHNYASGRLDYQTFYQSIRIEQADAETVILDRLFAAWAMEAVKSGQIPASDAWPHQWYWDGIEHVDPGKEASAQETRLKNRTTTYAFEYARQGRDWEAEFSQIAKERARMRELGIEDVAPQVTPATPAQTIPDDEGDDDEPPEPNDDPGE
jgi:lambda family phage portal protein